MTLAALVVLGAAFAGCGEDANEQSAGIVHRLFLAALAQDPDRLESFPGELPPDLPADFPIYPGGDLIVSSRELRAPEGTTATPAAGDAVTALYLILIDTGDSPADVFSYYEQALDEDPWQVESTVATTELQSVNFSLIADPDVTGRADIAHGRADDRTTVVVSIQDAGAEQIEGPKFEVPESLPAPGQWPEDVPIYEGAIITSSAFLREPTQESMELTFLTEDDQSALIDFYTSAFEDMGWQVEAASADGLADRLVFSDPDGSLNGAVQADRFANDRDYTEAVISIQQDTNREPGAGETPATADVTPAPATPGSATPTAARPA